MPFAIWPHFLRHMDIPCAIWTHKYLATPYAIQALWALPPANLYLGTYMYMYLAVSLYENPLEGLPDTMALPLYLQYVKQSVAVQHDGASRLDKKYHNNTPAMQGCLHYVWRLRMYFWATFMQKKNCHRSVENYWIGKKLNLFCRLPIKSFFWNIPGQCNVSSLCLTSENPIFGGGRRKKSNPILKGSPSGDGVCVCVCVCESGL